MHPVTQDQHGDPDAPGLAAGETAAVNPVLMLQLWSLTCASPPSVMEPQFWEKGGRTPRTPSSSVVDVWGSAWPITWPKVAWRTWCCWRRPSWRLDPPGTLYVSQSPLSNVWSSWSQWSFQWDSGDPGHRTTVQTHSQVDSCAGLSHCTSWFTKSKSFVVKSSET